VEGAFHRLANAARQMNVRRVDNDPLRVLFDADDPVERMLLLLGLFLMPGEMGSRRSRSPDATRLSP
jgi:hypothetical protein